MRQNLGLVHWVEITCKLKLYPYIKDTVEWKRKKIVFKFYCLCSWLFYKIDGFFNLKVFDLQF